MQYELKEVPAGSGNFYWYGRRREGGRQRSIYFGKTLPQSEVTQKSEYLASRKLEADRREIERKISDLKIQLSQLEKTSILDN